MNWSKNESTTTRTDSESTVGAWNGSAAAMLMLPSGLYKELPDRLTLSHRRSMLSCLATPGARSMTIGITRLHPHIGAEIAGADLSEPLDAATVDELWRAIDEHAVLVFHD